MEEISGEFKITPRHYQRLTERIAGKPEERILSYLMLRSLKQAHYSEENVGHFALASDTYTHFTSPIRRYPDLIVHRILKTALAQDARGKTPDAQQLHALGLETSDAERRAAEAERELMEWKKVAFMAGRMGEEFDALLISVTRHGLFVELVDLFVEGLVPLESLEGDRYVYREKLRAAVGERSKHLYRLGDRVKVRLDRIERSGNKLQFSVVK
jgi:ribonuclease R